MNELFPLIFLSEIRLMPTHLSARTRVDSDMMKFLEDTEGKEVADAFRKFVFDECEKHDTEGLLENIINEFLRIFGADETIKIDMNALMEQMNEDE